MTRLDVCLCTHSPRLELLAMVIRSVVEQTVDPGAFRFLLVDNASAPPLTDEVLAPLRTAGREAALTREPTPGLTLARLHAIERTAAPWMLFVDDDSVLTSRFVAEGLDFIGRYPSVGCFGGKLVLPSAVHAPHWARPYLPYLAIKDEGDEVITAVGQECGPWEPPGAGIWIRRDVLDAYRRGLERDSRGLNLGRKGKRGLASCEDALMARTAARVGLLAAYNPRMVLHHHIDPTRLRLRYLLRLMGSYGRSHALLESVLCRGEGRPLVVPEYYRSARTFRAVLRDAFRQAQKQSLRFALGMVTYHWHARAEYVRLAGEAALPAVTPEKALAANDD